MNTITVDVMKIRTIHFFSYTCWTRLACISFISPRLLKRWLLLKRVNTSHYKTVCLQCVLLRRDVMVRHCYWPEECIQTRQSWAWLRTGSQWTHPTTASGLWTPAAVQRTAGIPSQESWCLLTKEWNVRATSQIVLAIGRWNITIFSRH